MIETDLQLQIIKSCRNQGGVGYKITNEALKGIPDLFMALNYRHAFVETKFVRTGNTFRLSTAQRLKLYNLQKQKVPCCVAIIVPESYGEYRVFLTNYFSADAENTITGLARTYKPKGGEWPVASMIAFANEEFIS